MGAALDFYQQLKQFIVRIERSGHELRTLNPHGDVELSKWVMTRATLELGAK